MKNSIFKMTSLHLHKMGSGVRLAILAILSLTFTIPAMAQSTSYANAKGSSVVLNTWDNKDFIIEIDGTRHRADGSITLRNVNPGKKRIKVLRKRRNHDTRHLNGNSGQAEVLYSGVINVPKNSRVRAQITKRKNLRIISVDRNKPSKPNGNRPSSNSCESSNYQPYSGQLDSDYDQYGSEDFQPYGYENYGAYGGTSAMNMSEFNQAINRLEREPFSSEKKSIVRQMLRDKHISSKQLARILLTYSFDSDRLEIAKMAYRKVNDKRNTHEINSAFTFDSSVREFERFVRGER